MIVDMTLMLMVQMAIMQVIDVSLVQHGRVTAIRTMLMTMVLMDVMVCVSHAPLSSHSATTSRRHRRKSAKSP